MRAYGYSPVRCAARSGRCCRSLPFALQLSVANSLCMYDHDQKPRPLQTRRAGSRSATSCVPRSPGHRPETAHSTHGD
ncbi:hypothetical protein RJ55_03155 [Drechmeria coniospora]|nr:hypothetical protein RJ55_03155 [Drechmeria coniospora]